MPSWWTDLGAGTGAAARAGWAARDPLARPAADWWFAYRTVKVVRVKDRRLGAIHYLGLLGVSIYILVGVLLIESVSACPPAALRPGG